MRITPTITLSDKEQKELTKLARSKRTSVRLAQRARIVLLAASGLQMKAIAAQRQCQQRHTPVEWLKFLK